MDQYAELLARRTREHVAVAQALLADERLLAVAAAVARAMVAALRAGGRVLLFGNGGSATDAAHLAGELVGRFRVDRDPLPALALADNVAATTAIANDLGYADVFARPLRAFGRPGDVAVGLSTSGGSPNVVAALETARDGGLVTVAMTGARGGACARVAEHVLRVPTDDTPRVQECHMLLGHTVCELVEAAFVG